MTAHFDENDRSLRLESVHLWTALPLTHEGPSNLDEIQ